MKKKKKTVDPISENVLVYILYTNSYLTYVLYTYVAKKNHLLKMSIFRSYVYIFLYSVQGMDTITGG